MITGLFHVAPPLVERLRVTAAPFRLASSASPETIQTLCLASYATDGSLIRAYGPAGLEYTVVPDRACAVHDDPLFVETETPMSDDPPSVKRPHCAAATIVLPNEYVSGSTIVACWLVAFVNGSVAMIRTETFAEAESATTSAAVAASATASGSLFGRDEKANRIRLSPFHLDCRPNAV